ncbi:MAG TPA: DUF1761 domain-containing protein [Planctomycetota bacterium]|nr:DUF1761 domain-containing protein [Planctomycetota bacterium]
MPDAPVNWLAVLVAAGTSFAVGGLWYSPAMFLNAWNREAGRDPKTPGGHPAKVFGVAFLFCVVSAYVTARFVAQAPSIAESVGRAVSLGAGLVAASFGVNYQFASRSLLLWAIDAGYFVAQFAVYGLVLGMWR